MMEFRILGPLEVSDGARIVPLGGVKQRAVLAILLLHRGELVSVDRLVDELWGDEPPGTATKTVQVYVSRLRKLLGADVVATHHSGYLLEIEPEQLDAARFERLAAEGRAALERGDPGSARDICRQALELRRGRPLADLAYEPFAQGEIARIEELELAVLEDRIEADLAAGEHAALVPELETLVREHPARERLRGQLILALYRSGRQTDALESYRDARRALVDERGLEPGRELQELERAILRQDPELDPPARRRLPPTPTARRGGLVAAAGGVVLLAVVAAAVLVGGDDDSHPPRAPANSLAVIDPGSNELVASIPTGVRPADVAAAAGHIWVANQGDDTTTEIDPRRRTVVSTTSPGVTVAGLTADARGVWIGDARRSRLVRVDPGLRSVVRTVRIAPGPEALGTPGANPVASGFGSLWVGRGYGAVARVDPDTRQVRNLAVGNSPSDIAAGAGSVWVTDDTDNTLARIDPGTANAVIETTPVGRGPLAVAVGGGAVWVANTQDDAVARVDPSSATVTGTTRVGRRPTGIAVGGGAVWVANSLSGTVSRIDPASGEVEATVDVGEAPQGLTVADGLVWVTVQQRATPERAASSLPGGVARLLVPDDPGGGDPAVDTDFQVLSATCALLYNYPDRPYPDGARLEPEVAADKPSVSSDGRTYEFTIRRGFRFSPPSNAPVTAEAFERAIERGLSPKVGSFAGEVLPDIVGARAFRAGGAQRIAGLSAHGRKLVIRLERPSPNLTTRLAARYFCAVPPETPMTPKGVDALPSAGPYYVASYIPSRSLVLRRNPDYHGPRPHTLAEIRYTLGVPADRAVAAVRAGRADYVQLNGGAREGVPASVERRLTKRYGPRSEAARAGRQQLFTQPSLSVYSFMFNTHRGPFADVRLRRAASFAMDRRALAQHTGIGERGRPTDQFIPPGLPGFEDAAVYPLGGPDLETARRLAGGKRRRALLYTCTLPGCTAHAEILRSNLRAIGIDLDVRQFPLEELFRRMFSPSKPFDIGYWNWFVDYGDPFGYINQQFAHDGGGPGLFEGAGMERRMSRAAALSGDARLRTYAKLDRDLAARAVPGAAFATGTTSYFLSARMGCQVLHPLFGLDLAALCVKQR